MLLELGRRSLASFRPTVTSPHSRLRGPTSKMIPSPKELQISTLLLVLLVQGSCSAIGVTPASHVQKDSKPVAAIPHLHLSSVNGTAAVWVLYYDHLSADFPDLGPKQKLMINITYQLIYGELSNYQESIFCHMQERVLMHLKPKNYRNECREEIFSFKSTTVEGSLDNHCDSHTETHFMYIERMAPFTIGNLLSHQTYEVNLALYIMRENMPTPVENQTHYICLSEGPPRFAPQTDLASFSFPSNLTVGDDEEHVDLIWRPLPRVFAGSNTTSYEVYCETDQQEVMHNSTTPPNVSHMRITKRSNMAYMCKVRSKNKHGYAPGFSAIVIPGKENLLDLGPDFRFYAYAISQSEYWLEWTPIKIDVETRRVTILPRTSAKEAAEMQEGDFTIYWCVTGRSKGCSELSGMVTTNSTGSFTILLPPSTKGPPLMFGISYTRKKPPLSTGIIWSKCISEVSHQFIGEPLRISQVATIENNHKALTLNWDFINCDSQVAVIESYLIEYCKVKEITGCSVLWSSLEIEDMSKYRFGTSNDECTTIVLPNRFHNAANVTNLDPSSRYVFRLRYNVTAGGLNPWSEPKSAVTLSDPELVSRCLDSFKWNFGIVTFVVCLTLAVCCTKSKSWYNYYNLIQSKFKRTSENICNFVTTVTANDRAQEVTFRYYVDDGKGQLTRSQSDLSLSFLAQEGGPGAVGSDGVTSFEHNGADYNQINQIFDYIPKKLIEGSTNDTTPESSSNSNRDELKYDNTSEQDEISVDSNPLIWETNSDDELRLDFNNNQASK